MKINNKGITLLEVIIAMFILSVVVFVGYKVINGNNKATDIQKHTTKGQLSTNLVNKYLSKDIEILESKEKIEDPKDTNRENITIDKASNTYKQVYTYIIDTVNHDEGGSVVDKVEYVVNHTGRIDGNELKGIYSVNRISKNSENKVISDLELVSNQKTIYTEESISNIEECLEDKCRPFIIEDKGSNLYKVGVKYETNNKEKNYEFDILPRISVAKIDSGQPPIVDPDMKPQPNNIQNGYIKFVYTKDKQVYREIGYSKFIEEDKYETKIINQDNPYRNRTILEHEICAEFSPGNSNGFAEVTNMKPQYTIPLDGKDQMAFPNMNVDLINITIVGDTSAIITVSTNRSGNTFDPEYKDIEIDSGKESFKLKTSNGQNDKIKNVRINGKSILNKIDGKGEVIITFGKSKTR